MDTVSIIESPKSGRDFIPSQFLPQGKNEYYLRNQQFGTPDKKWRHLRSFEVEMLVKNNNSANEWDDIWVTDEFDPDLIKNSEFFGMVRIGRLTDMFLQHHDLQLPAGITNSKIISCDIGDDVAIHNVPYLAHYIIGERCILANIDEMHTTNHAKFGNGILKDGEDEDVRVWLDVMNETGARQIMPFDGMLPADAYLWAKYRDDEKLQKKLGEYTQNQFDSRRGYYGTVGEQCVIKNSRILKDVKIGSHCYIKGANKLKNLTINSTIEEKTQIGEGVELVNGIIGNGCHIFYGCKAVRFVLRDRSNLKYGARLINSFLGENSTISCCEVLNNLIFPAHEQHHNNSFLIASVVKGQSNMAAGATIGSNHNSRANDNEIEAGRGFWPGLCSSVKHSSRFASFILLAKADYPAEMNIPLPFSLLNNNVSQDMLEVMPAFWWLYDMYALARNTWKFQARDKRQHKRQHIEFNSLAPDTVEELLQGRDLLALWTAKAWLYYQGKYSTEMSKQELISKGRDLLAGPEENLLGITVLGENIEKSNRRVIILKAQKGYQAYEQMIVYYGITNLLDYLEKNPQASFKDMTNELSGERQTEWVNVGGQLVKEQDVQKLRADIGNGALDSWAAIHKRYDELWDNYPKEKQRHALASLCSLLGTSSLTKKQWHKLLDRAVSIQELIRDRVYESRQKDYDNPFRQATYRNLDEMYAAIGTVEDNSFIQQVQKDTESFKKRINEIKNR